MFSQTQPILLDNFSNDLLHFDTWYQIKNNFSTILYPNFSQVNIVPTCQHLLKLLKELTSCSDLDTYFHDKLSLKAFFCNKLFPIAAKSIISSKYIDTIPVEEVFNRCLEQMVLLWLKSLPADCPGLTKTANLVLNPNPPYYIFTTSILQSFKNTDPNLITWIGNLKIQDIGDFVKIENVSHQATEIIETNVEAITGTEILIAFFWKVLLNEDYIYLAGFFEKGLAGLLITMKKKYPYDSIPKIIDCCILNIEQNSFVYTSLRVIRDCRLINKEVADEKSSEAYVNDREKDLLVLLIKYFDDLQSASRKEMRSPQYYLDQIEMGLSLLEQILVKTESVITYEIIERLWKIFVEEPVIEVERTLLIGMLMRVDESQKGIPMRFDDLVLFFKEKVNSAQSLNCLAITEKGVELFIDLFMKVNKGLGNIKMLEPKSDLFVGNVPPSQLAGIEGLWTLVLTDEEKGTGAWKATNMFCQIYTCLSSSLEPQSTDIRKNFLKDCFRILKNCKQSQVKKCSRIFKLLDNLMNESENQGLGSYKPYAKLSRSVYITITVHNKVNAMSPKNVQLKVALNNTVYEFLVMIGKSLNVPWDELMVHSDSDIEIIDCKSNAKTLAEIGFRMYDVIAKRTDNMRQEFLQTNKESSKTALRVALTQVFDQYSDNGVMGSENCTAFINSFTDVCSNPRDGRVKRIFLRSNTKRDGCLSLEEFLDLLMYSQYNQERIVNILRAHNIRSDFKTVEQVNSEKSVDVSRLVSYMISSNEEHFDIIYSFLDLEDARASKAWTLLNRLEVKPQLLKDIVMLKGVRDVQNPRERDWDCLLNTKSRYKLLYRLTIVEYFLSSNRGINDVPLLNDLELLKYVKTWKQDFVSFGGFDHLCEVINAIETDWSELREGIVDVLASIKEEFDPTKKLGWNMTEAEQKSLTRFLSLAPRRKDSYSAFNSVRQTSHFFLNLKMMYFDI